MSITMSGSSGIDVSNLITQLSNIRNQKVLSLQNTKVQLTRQADTFTQVQTRLDDFIKNIGNITQNLNAMKVTSSNSDVANIVLNNNSLGQSLSINVEQLATRDKIGTAEIDPTKTFGELGIIPSTISVNGQHITIKESDTILDLHRAIMTANPPAVTSSIIKMPNGNHRLVMSSEITGANKLEIESVYGNAFGVLGLDTLIKGQDAKFSINGVNMQSSDNNLNDVIDNVQIELRAIGQTNIRIEKDNEQISDNISDLINNFNAINKFINDNNKISVDDNYNMTRGALANDSTTRNLQNQLQNAFRNANLQEFGITTNWRTGELVIDQEKLTKAISSNPDKINQIFGDLSDTVSTIGNNMKSAFEARESSIQRQQRQLDDRIQSEQRRVENHRTLLVNQFSAMEQTINMLRQQQTAMFSMLGVQNNF